jgi:hypothetical protein
MTRVDSAFDKSILNGVTLNDPALTSCGTQISKAAKTDRNHFIQIMEVPAWSIGMR